MRERNREQHGLGRDEEEQNLGTGGGLEEGGSVQQSRPADGGGVQSREEQSSCAWEVGKGRGRSCSCVGSGEGKGSPNGLNKQSLAQCGCSAQ
jgi:hypothetical protein